MSSKHITKPNGKTRIYFLILRCGLQLQGKDSNSFRCKFCLGTLSTLGNMEATALKNHMGYDKHRVFVKVHKTQSELMFHANNGQKASTSSSSSVKRKKSGVKFCYTNCSSYGRGIASHAVCDFTYATL